MNSFFQLSHPKEKLARKINGILSDYGIGLNVIIPGLQALVAPLNKMRLYALSPTIFEFEFLKLLKFFVEFQEEDLFIHFNGERVFQSHENFRPKNEMFTFHSVYPKIKITFILLRALATFFFALRFGMLTLYKTK